MSGAALFLFAAAVTVPLGLRAVDPQTPPTQESQVPLSHPLLTTEPLVVVVRVDPDYTREARELRLEGRVVLHVWADRKGHLERIRVVRSMGHGLDEKAIEAVKQWRFRPARKNGVPIASEGTIDMDFRLSQPAGIRVRV